MNNVKEELSNVKAMQIADNLIWGAKNLHKIFVNQGIWIWPSEYSDDARCFDSIKPASVLIDGIRTSRNIKQ